MEVLRPESALCVQVLSQCRINLDDPDFFSCPVFLWLKVLKVHWADLFKHRCLKWSLSIMIIDTYFWATIQPDHLLPHLAFYLNRLLARAKICNIFLYILLCLYTVLIYSLTNNSPFCFYLHLLQVLKNCYLKAALVTTQYRRTELEFLLLQLKEAIKKLETLFLVLQNCSTEE